MIAHTEQKNASTSNTRNNVTKNPCGTAIAKAMNTTFKHVTEGRHTTPRRNTKNDTKHVFEGIFEGMSTLQAGADGV